MGERYNDAQLRAMASQEAYKTRRETAEVIALLNTDGAARALGVGRRTVQVLVEERKLATVRIGRCLRFDPADIAAFIETNRVKVIGWKGTPAR